MSSRDPLQERDPLKEVEDALSFPTSPDFCARVRQQVATEPMRSRFFGAQGLAVAAAAVLAAAIGVLATYRSPEVESANVRRPVVVDATKRPAEHRAAPVVARASAPMLPRAARSSAMGTVTAFQTLVPDDQRRALDHLLAAMREGRATVPPAEPNEELNDNGQRVPRALIIEPMKLALLAGTPGEPIKDPVKDPIK